MTRTILALFFFIAFAAPALPARAQESPYYPIGQVAAVEGQAWFVGSDSGKRPARAQDPVYMNATIETGKGSKLMILFVDDTQLTLAENSRLLIDSFVFDPYDSSENEGEFEISGGAFNWLSGMLSKRERPHVKIKTDIGSIGIRGTQFWAGHVENGFGVFVSDGLVDFSGDWGAVEIPAGDGVFIGPDKNEPPARNFWTAARRQTAIERVTFRAPGLDETLEKLKADNVRKRNDLHGRVFPYKPGRGHDAYTPEQEDFFTDEFNKMRKEKGQ